MHADPLVRVTVAFALFSKAFLFWGERRCATANSHSRREKRAEVVVSVVLLFNRRSSASPLFHAVVARSEPPSIRAAALQRLLDLGVEVLFSPKPGVDHLAGL